MKSAMLWDLTPEQVLVRRRPHLQCGIYIVFGQARRPQLSRPLCESQRSAVRGPTLNTFSTRFRMNLNVVSPTVVRTRRTILLFRTIQTVISRVTGDKPF